METCLVARTSIVYVLFASVISWNSFVPCSAVNGGQQSGYTEARLNITFCDRFGKGCSAKVFDRSGNFGIHSPKHGARGWLYALKELNVNGCKEFNIKIDKTPWIALIKRGVCNFVDKLKNAQKHNATAAIIYDNQDSVEAVKMLHGDANSIVAVSVGKTLGDELASALVNSTNSVYVEILVGESDSYPTSRGWRVNPTSVLFVSVSFIVLMVISLAWLVFYYVQRFRYVHARDKTEVSNVLTNQ